MRKDSCWYLTWFLPRIPICRLNLLMRERVARFTSESAHNQIHDELRMHMAGIFSPLQQVIFDEDWTP